MKFRKYQHIERFGTIETEGITKGKCYIFPKIDGTNSSVWLRENEIKAGSRNRTLSLGNDNAGFYAEIIKDENIKKCLQDNPNLRIFGEWLVPHSIKTYEDFAWRQFYIFDIIEEISEEEVRYLPYEEYSVLLDKYNLLYLKPLAIIDNPLENELIEIMSNNKFLIKPDSGIGEGIVIKNYNYINKFGRITWAKIVAREFRETKGTLYKKTALNSDNIENQIVETFVTIDLCEKEYAKIELEDGGFRSIKIPKLLNMVYYNLIKEDIYNILKKYKYPTIDFKLLQSITFRKVKELLILHN